MTVNNMPNMCSQGLLKTFYFSNKSKVKYTSICIALYHGWSLMCSGMARVNEGSHSFTCHPHVYPQVEWTIPAFTPQPQSIIALWLVLISRPAEGRRLSWPGWLGEILRGFARQRRSPIPVLTGWWYVENSTKHRPKTSKNHMCIPKIAITNLLSVTLVVTISYLKPFCMTSLEKCSTY